MWVLLILMATSVRGGYHMRSRKTLTPPPELKNSYFGYSLGYQGNYIGAPHADKIGQLYKCNVNDILEKNVEICTQAEFNHGKLYFEDLDSKNQPVTLWSSITSTKNFVTTCTALFGQCFLYRPETNESEPIITTVEEQDNDKFKKGRWGSIPSENKESVFLMKFLADSLRDQENFELSYVNNSLHTDKMQACSIEDGSSLLGHTAGKFFSDVTSIVYAISSFTEELQGRVRFISPVDSASGSTMKNLKTLKNSESGAMYGALLHASDLNGDGLSELLVSAPLHFSGTGYECGAVFIYVGGKKSAMDKDKRMLYSTIDGGRFGTAIATSDINSDSVPELFVSAPFEGFGKIYIFSGSDILDILKRTSWSVDMSELSNTIVLEGNGLPSFGSSLYILPDVDDNGCDELLAGTPNSQSVMLYRCVPIVNVDISSSVEKYIDSTIPESVTEFTINACVNLVYPPKPETISINLLIKNGLIRKDVKKYSDKNVLLNAEDEKYEIKLFERIASICKNITVNVATDDPGRYTFTTIIELDKNIDIISEFNTTWVEVKGVMRKELEITRGCGKALECVPKLLMTLQWSLSKEYELGGNLSESINVIVRNDGTSANRACVKIRASGGVRLTRSDTLDLPKPFKNSNTFNEKVDIQLNAITNQDTMLLVIADLYKRCDEDVYETQILQSKVKIDTSKIILQKFARDLDVKDSVTVDEIMQSNSSNHLAPEHQYSVTNLFNVMWRNLQIDILVQKNDYLIEANILGTLKDNCTKIHANNTILIICKFDLKPLQKINVFIPMLVLKDVASKYIVDGKLNIQSSIKVFLLPTSKIIETTLESEINFEAMKFYNNKGLMACICIILGFVFLGLIAAALYKLGFFQRKEKAKLYELKKEIRHQSVRRNTSVGVEAVNDGIPETIMCEDDVFMLDDSKMTMTSKGADTIDTEETQL